MLDDKIIELITFIEQSTVIHLSDKIATEGKVIPASRVVYY